ncbi:amino acid ABC transporter permease [Bosea sp. (in: a-proteobacteria)]|uniref:amino acid ABC transporter permease n=1 Tax=Bosea sp. (in: a-proteobacteria) TaxID=1871050 RepID=UPI002621BB9D|nr:amino acid ABC transporter permease [Bosea sp. (in: a-proteobacteria)]MCO5092144.1 amino acid ABC transporter permease [Bosea sp. (in: a-proteobacteria)]
MNTLLDLQPGLIWTYRQTLFEALLITLWLTVASSIAGISVGVVLAVAERLIGRSLSWLVTCYVELFRNTPLLVQLMWMHFALPMITGVPLTPSQSGFFTLTLSAGAYFTEIVRGGIVAIPRGQWEASNALGLPRWLTFRLVILPQALRIMMPPLVNMILSVFKGTTIMSILSVGELLQNVSRISNYTFRSVEIFTFAALIYLLIGLSFDMLARHLESHLRQSGR